MGQKGCTGGNGRLHVGSEHLFEEPGAKGG